MQEYTADHRGHEIEMVRMYAASVGRAAHKDLHTVCRLHPPEAASPASANFPDSDHPSFGSSVVDHSATSARSRNVTVSCPVAPLILTWPKNCIPAVGGRFCLSSPGALMNFTSGPKVLSSSFGPKVPACNGPETNSQNGSKS